MIYDVVDARLGEYGKGHGKRYEKRNIWNNRYVLEFGASDAEILEKLQEKFSLPYDEAVQYMLDLNTGI